MNQLPYLVKNSSRNNNLKDVLSLVTIFMTKWQHVDTSTLMISDGVTLKIGISWGWWRTGFSFSGCFVMMEIFYYPRGNPTPITGIYSYIGLEKRNWTGRPDTQRLKVWMGLRFYFVSREDLLKYGTGVLESFFPELLLLNRAELLQ